MQYLHIELRTKNWRYMKNIATIEPTIKQREMNFLVVFKSSSPFIGLLCVKLYAKKAITKPKNENANTPHIGTDTPKNFPYTLNCTSAQFPGPIVLTKQESSTKSLPFNIAFFCI